MEAPELTILVPMFNVGPYLRECLDSLVEQSFTNFEAILLNDGSTDDTSVIAHEYESDSRFRVIDKPNSGYGATLNVGLREAQGSYIGFLESDDKLYPRAFERLMTAAEAYDADIVRGTFSLWWAESGRELDHNPYDADLLNRPIDPRTEPRLFLYKPAIWSGVFRRRLLEDNDISFLETPGASYQDASFAFKTFAAARSAVFIAAPIIHYRQDREAASVRSRGKVYAVKGEYDEIDRWLARRHDTEHATQLARASTIARCNAYLWNVDRIAPEFKPEFIHNMSLEFSKMDDAGRIPWDALDAWHTITIKKIISNPDRYLHIREKSRGVTSMSKAIFALRLGGPVALHAAMRETRAR